MPMLLLCLLLSASCSVLGGIFLVNLSSFWPDAFPFNCPFISEFRHMLGSKLGIVGVGLSYRPGALLIQSTASEY